EIGSAVASTAPGGQQRKMPNRRRRIDDPRKLRVNRNGQRRSGLLLAHGQLAIANVLAADAHHVAAALCGENPKSEGQALLGANGMVRLKRGNLVFGPGVMSV